MAPSTSLVTFFGDITGISLAPQTQGMWPMMTDPATALPVASFNFIIAGVHYEGREHRIRRFARAGDQVYLVREPQNQFSRNAIQVALKSGIELGYVPEIDAEDLAPLLDVGLAQKAHITKILVGGRVPIPVVQAYVHRLDAEIEGISIVSRGFGS